MPQIYRAEIQLPFRALGEQEDADPLDPESPVILALITERLGNLGYQMEPQVSSKVWGNLATTRIGGQLLVVQVDQLTFGEWVNNYRVWCFYAPKVSLLRLIMRTNAKDGLKREGKFTEFVDALDAELAELLRPVGGAIVRKIRGEQVK
jgi:hypothetical protein